VGGYLTADVVHSQRLACAFQDMVDEVIFANRKTQVLRVDRVL